MSVNASVAAAYDRQFKELLLRHGIVAREHRLQEDLTKQALMSLKTDFEFFLFRSSWALTYFKTEHVLGRLVELGSASNEDYRAVAAALGSAALRHESCDEEMQTAVADALVPDMSLERIEHFLSSYFSIKLRAGHPLTWAKFELRFRFDTRSNTRMEGLMLAFAQPAAPA